MISYYKYWQAIKKYTETMKTVEAMHPDVPPWMMAQSEMDEMVMKYWQEKSEKFTKYFLIFLMVFVIIVTAYFKGYINV